MSAQDSPGRAATDASPNLEPAALIEENAALRRTIARLEAENQRLSDQYSESAYLTSNLESLYVASQTLHDVFDRSGVCAILQEIVANLIGCEEMAVFELDAAERVLRLTCSNGLDAERFDRTPLDAGIIGQTVRSGTLFVEGARDGARLPEEEHLSACVPLKLNGQAFGAIALFRLLPQKSGYEPIDHQLFNLLESHAATALHVAHLRTGREE